jgi:hypothetical protein
MNMIKHLHDYHEITGSRPVMQVHCLSETILTGGIPLVIYKSAINTIFQRQLPSKICGS